MSDLTAVSVDDTIRSAVAGGAIVAFSLSGGKDSTVAAHSASAMLDMWGHPHSDRIAIHADLGRAEWKSTPGTVRAVAERLGVPLVVCRHGKHDMVSRWEARFAEGKRRYAALEIFNLIGPWSSSSLRFCTAELKQQVIAPALQRRFPGRTIVSVVGIRRAESVKRRSAAISKPEPRWDRRDGTHLLTWHPILDMPTEEVFRHHDLWRLPLHEAYVAYGSSRVSCAFCVMQSEADQRAAMACPDNRELAIQLVDLEARSTFSFQPARWLGDVVSSLLPAGLRADFERAKGRGELRRQIEAGLPADLRYVAGWPRRVPTDDEADEIVAARASILHMHDLPISYPTRRSVIDRFAELMARAA